MLQYSDQEPTDPLTLLLYPPDSGGKGFSMFYEDDGLTFEYARGVYARRTIEQQVAEKELRIALGASEGTYNPPSRRLVLHLVGERRRPARVAVDGHVTQEWTGGAGGREEGRWEFDPKSGDILVKMADRKQSMTVIITY